MKLLNIVGCLVWLFCIVLVFMAGNISAAGGGGHCNGWATYCADDTGNGEPKSVVDAVRDAALEEHDKW